jgi:peptide methionine sulfoxide reductase MsrA
MKYKIQTEGAFGWGDLKYSEDNGKTYQVDLYDSKEQADEELNNILSEFEEDSDGYRIVTEDVVEDFNIYAE